jgi:selenocysteine-specific elongation factor
MRVVGTAGHVDHGKSTLVAALTGTHPDRLKEEQAREMTIDLGFAWLNLPGGEEVGIIDVPGHRDFIENMLAGVGGIDAAIFVVAADEGVMPQTREHLAILDLLQVKVGVIVLTKVDLVEEPEWLDLVEADVHAATYGTVLEEAPLVRVSARSGFGLDQLKIVLAEILHKCPTRPNSGRPRLPVDRVFTIAGFGTVVTGTQVDGEFQHGDDVVVLPQGVRGRIRGLQNHKHKVEVSLPGSRTAMNISGVDVDQIHRGNVVATPDRYQSTKRLDVHFRLLADITRPLRHDTQVKLFIGAAEIQARVRLLGVEELNPGNSGWLQLEMAEPVVAVRGDRYILRLPSPGETLGGGVVVDPHPGKRYKRFDPGVIRRLEALLQGSPADILLQAAFSVGILPAKELSARTRMAADDLAQAYAELIQRGDLMVLETGACNPQSDLLVLPLSHWTEHTHKMQAGLTAFHQQYPLRRGMPREELKSRLGMIGRAFNASMARWISTDLLVEVDNLVHIPGHLVRFNREQQLRVDELFQRIDQAPYATPSVKECQEAVGEPVYQALLDQGEWVVVAPDVLFRKRDYERLVEGVISHLKAKGTLTVAEFRDRYQTSRKYALGLLEHLDQRGITRREGDFRKLRD